MAYKVRTERMHIMRLVNSRNKFFVEPSDETLKRIAAEILINEKGYPNDTVVIIDGDDSQDMVLIVDDDGSWELV